MSELLDYFKGDELAASVWQGKYAQKGEVTPADMHKRMAKEFARIEKNYQEKEIVTEETIDKFNDLSDYGKKREDLTEEKIFEFFDEFKKIIPQGSIMSQLGADSIGSLSNCFVIGQPEDSYGGIFQKDEEMAQLMKRRGGVGIDISTLRPQGVGTSNAAKSSTGAVSFMHRFSNTTREVAQNGRRGALMISIDINHPDVMEFIKIKRDLTQVTGANISIKLNKEFMEAVEKDEDYLLRFPCTEDLQGTSDTPYGELVKIHNKMGEKGNYDVFIKRVKAREYWDEIIKSAHNVAEPGFMFWGAMVNYSPDGIYPQFKQVTTNPCSEIGMQPYDACRLIAVNLFSFVKNPYTDEAYFDRDEFYKLNYEAMRLSDDLVDLELEHIERIIQKLHSDPEDLEVKYRELRLWTKVKETATASRRTGLGFTALGDTLASLGLRYDSDEALDVIETIMQTKMLSELDCTTDLAIIRGTFQGWDRNLEFPNEGGSYEDQGGNDFYTFIIREFFPQFQKMYKYGRRNVSWSTVAPTGSLSIMAMLETFCNVSSGIEPLFMPFYMRRKKVNPNDEVSRVDFTDENGDTWQEYGVLMGGFKEWIKVNKDYSVDKINNLSKEELEVLYLESPYLNSTANDIDWIRRVEIQSTIQKYITHSISSTINLPENVTEAEVSDIYLESYKKGLKGITVYRDGSRSGVLVSSDKKETSSTFEYNNATKRPKTLNCKIHQSTNKGEKWLIIVGMLDNKPYEVFCLENTYNLPNVVLDGTFTKVKKGVYELDIKDSIKIPNITSEMTDELAAITRLTSTSLRHGADIKFIVEQLLKCDGDLFSFTKSLSRVLKKYIPDGAKASVKCNDCGSDNVVFQEGCLSCLDCGGSACS